MIQPATRYSAPKYDGVSQDPWIIWESAENRLKGKTQHVVGSWVKGIPLIFKS